jgi:two-component system nitrate/nitrite response regulator NarL
MRIVIVDDHALMRRGMADVVRDRFPEADVVEVEGASALGVMRENASDLVLIDVRMPDLDGLELLRAMKLEWPSVPVILISTDEDAPSVRRALSDGAAGYLMKDATPEFLEHVIEAAISGKGNLLSQRALQTLFDDVAPSSGISTDVSGSRLTGYNLTQREQDILALLPDGQSNRAIARHLFLSEKTVKSHLAAIFRKLGVTNRTQAAMMAMQLGVQPVARAVSGAVPGTEQRPGTDL